MKMTRQEFSEKLNSFFNQEQIGKLADYAERLDSMVKYGAIGDMNGYSFLCIRMAEEASKGVMWLTQKIADWIGEETVMNDMPDFKALMEQIDVEW